MRPLIGAVPYSSAPAPTAASCSTSTPYAPCVIDTAYGVSSLLTAGYNGTGTTIGVVDVYDGIEPQAQLVGDVATFTTSYGLPHGTIHYLYPVPTSANLNTTSTGWGSEEALDLEWSRATAPGATIDMTFAPDPTTGLYSSVDWLVAHQAVNVISLSWGEPDVGAYNPYAGACASACNASSDGSVLHPPSGDGGRGAPGHQRLRGVGRLRRRLWDERRGDELPCLGPVGDGRRGHQPGREHRRSLLAASPHGAATTAGVTTPAVRTRAAPAEATPRSPGRRGRARPDIPRRSRPAASPTFRSSAAPPLPSSRADTVEGPPGTSVSCPIWAGLTAIADQIRGAPLGFLDPALYRLARSANASSYFHDVTSGSNGYKAGTGWDPVTGLGSPKANALLPALTAIDLSVSPLFADLRASPRSGTAPLSVAFSSIAYNASASIEAFDVDFGDGNATWSPNGFANHTYTKSGVYLARTVAFLTDGNSSVSPPISIVVGGGALTVGLTASTTTPAAGALVTLTTNVTGGTAPYRYSYAFGDGTYLSRSTQSSVAHAYAVAGTYCVVVVVSDAASPPDGGSSARLAILVGGASGGSCHPAAGLTATINASARYADLPGDLTFHVNVSGGTPPYSIRYVADNDPYVGACNCGLFSRTGVQDVGAYVNDSQSGSTLAWTWVDLFPALDATFRASPTGRRGPPHRELHRRRRGRRCPERLAHELDVRRRSRQRFDRSGRRPHVHLSREPTSRPPG